MQIEERVGSEQAMSSCHRETDVNVDHSRDEEDFDVNPYERLNDDGSETSKYAPAPDLNSHGGFLAAFLDNEEELVAPAVVLPWRIALLLFTTTLAQNFSYRIGPFADIYNPSLKWTTGEQNQFNQLVFNMIYLGPVFGLMVDVARVFRERYRPVIILACVVNAILCFICVGVPTLNQHYGRTLIISWLIEVAVMFIYIPCNALVISYGNTMLQSPDESSARIGGLMAQSMVVRTFGSLISEFVFQFASPRIHSQPDRWMLLIGAIISCVVIVQVLLPVTMKRSYFVDRREASLKHSAPVRFYLSVIRARRNAVSRRKKPTNTTFMFILCFIFIYFMLPDTLYNTLYSFNGVYTPSFSKGLKQANAILGSIGAVLGAFLYAVWMWFAHEHERKRHRLAKTNPFQIMLAGCCAWALGSFIHLIGATCYDANHFSPKVFIPFQSILVQTCLRFAFMPTLSLASMHAPRGYETTAFELYSVDTTGGGTVSYPITSNLMQSMGVTDPTGETQWGFYWKVALICVFFRFLPLLVALSLPKHRDEDEPQPAPREIGECEPLRSVNREDEVDCDVASAVPNRA